MSYAHFEGLCIPLNRDISQFEHELLELHRQFETIRNDPYRGSNNPDKQFAYKTRLVRWYYKGIPEAKFDLVKRLVSFWTAMPSALAMMAFCDQEQIRTNGALPLLMMMQVDSCQDAVQGLKRTVLELYTDMEELKKLNPKWRGAAKCPLFTMEGCVLGSDPKSERWAAWKGVLNV